MRSDLSCRDFVEFLMAYLDEELPGEERQVFEQHMRDCPPCQVYLDTYRESVRMGGAVCCEEQQDVPEDVPDQLVRAILEARRRS